MKCKHKNWVTAEYPENMYGGKYVRVQSMYEVYCKDCKNFVNLLTNKTINDKGLIITY